MGCQLNRERDRAVIQLVDALDDDDFDRIQSWFEQSLREQAAGIILDFARLSAMNAQLAAMIGALRLQARRAGTAIELRNLAARHIHGFNREGEAEAAASW